MQAPKPLRKALLDWYAHARRKLPWREQPSLYGTVVSEFMLQQTQVSTVLPYYDRWLKVFPDFASLAAASEVEVVKQWEGLGYYSRARNLQRLACEVTANGLPDTFDGWLALPGVGPYTAAAIVSIGLDLPHAVVDGNVVRVLTRLYAIESNFSNNASAVKSIAPLADALLAQESPGDFNQAVMELGATVCTKGQPSCVICPWRPYCKAAGRGDPSTFPRIQRRAVVQKSVQRIWLQTAAGLLMERIPDTAKRLAGHYELPLAESCQDFVSINKRPLVIKKRGIANESISEAIHACTLKSGVEPSSCLSAETDLQWIPIAQLESIQISGPHRRWIRGILGTANS